MDNSLIHEATEDELRKALELAVTEAYQRKLVTDGYFDIPGPDHERICVQEESKRFIIDARRFMNGLPPNPIFGFPAQDKLKESCIDVPILETLTENKPKKKKRWWTKLNEALNADNGSGGYEG